MKLLTHNMLACTARGVQNGYPLKIEAAEVVEREADFDADFLRHMFPKLEWAAFLEGARAVRGREAGRRRRRGRLRGRRWGGGRWQRRAERFFFCGAEVNGRAAAKQSRRNTHAPSPHAPLPPTHTNTNTYHHHHHHHASLPPPASSTAPRACPTR